MAAHGKLAEAHLVILEDTVLLSVASWVVEAAAQRKEGSGGVRMRMYHTVWKRRAFWYVEGAPTLLNRFLYIQPEEVEGGPPREAAVLPIYTLPKLICQCGHIKIDKS